MKGRKISCSVWLVSIAANGQRPTFFKHLHSKEFYITGFASFHVRFEKMRVLRCPPKCSQQHRAVQVCCCWVPLRSEGTGRRAKMSRSMPRHKNDALMVAAPRASMAEVVRVVW